MDIPFSRFISICFTLSGVRFNCSGTDAGSDGGVEALLSSMSMLEMHRLIVIVNQLCKITSFSHTPQNRTF